MVRRKFLQFSAATIGALLAAACTDPTDAVAGSDAAVPATLLRSRRIRISGSGAGSVSTERMIAELPKVAALIADGTLDAPYTAYPLDRIGEAWAHAGRDRAVVTPR